MNNSNPRKYEIQEYIGDWHFDAKSHKFATELGAFLFTFIDYLDQSDMSIPTFRKHLGNVQLIGWFECDYGYRDVFEPKIFKAPPFYDIEFKRKVSDSTYAIQSYIATCNKLSKYVVEKLYETVEPYDFEIPEEIDDLWIGLRLLGKIGNSKGTRHFESDMKTIKSSFVVELADVKSRAEFIERMEKCASGFDAVIHKLDTINFDKGYFSLYLIEQLRQDALLLKGYIVDLTLNI